jgi:hypothetical protein
VYFNFREKEVFIMATPTAHVRSLRETPAHAREHAMKASHLEAANERKNRRNSPVQLMHETVRYEKYSKYWSILSNAAAIVSVAGALFASLRKTRRWF